MRKIIIILVFVSLNGLVFLLGPEVIPENFQPEEIFNTVLDEDVIIIFNSGGWGNTPLEKAQDFAPIIQGIQATLNSWGYKSIVIPYIRTQNNLFGKITGTKEFLNSFQNSSEDFAKRIEYIAANLPNKKIIIAGLSNGAAFVNETYEKISEEFKDSIYTITVGTPFWTKTVASGNILQLDNNGKDSLAQGDIQSLLFSLIKTPFRWVLAKIQGENLSFSEAFQASGHRYSWSSSEVSSQIITFLKSKFH